MTVGSSMSFTQQPSGHGHDSSTLISSSNEESDSESDGALCCHGSERKVNMNHSL